MGKHLIVLGHGQGPDNYDPGAKGCGTCEDEFLNKEFLPHLEKHAPSNVGFYTAKNMYEYREALTISGYDTVTELHLDWSPGGQADGGHVIIWKGYEPDKVDLNIRDVVEEYVGLRSGDGISYRSDLFNLNTFAKRGITYRLVELGFINNGSDMKKIRKNINAYAAALITAITGSQVQTASINPDAAPEPTDDGRYRLATGPFKDAASLARAHDMLKKEYGWMIYERADDTNFNPALRLWTGPFVGRNVTEYYAEEVREKFSWTVYVKRV